MEFHKHIASCYKIAKEGSILNMPQPGQVVKFKNHRNKMERPFVVYADTECTNVRTGLKMGNVTRHVVNSCAYLLVCTFDPSRNIKREFKGRNCVTEMIVDLFAKADA